jgi:tRNA(fMet)-specific endonuclease VapC
MSLYILDTDILSLLQENHPAVVARVASCPPEEMAITIISVEEQLSGWYRRLRQAKKPSDLARVYERLMVAVRSLARLSILSFTENAIQRSKNLKVLYRNIRNIRDFQQILPVEDWSK